MHIKNQIIPNGKTNTDHLKILRRGVGVWNQWRQDNLNIIPWLVNSILVNKNLDDIDFSKMTLAGSNLNFTSLNRANLSYTNLYGARGCVEFNEANLYAAEFYIPSPDAWLGPRTYLGNSEFNKADLRYVNMMNIIAPESKFNFADIRYAKCSGSYLGYSEFKGASLSGANFVNARLTECDFSNADLSEANFNGAQMNDVNLTNTNLEKTDFSFTNLSGANLKGAKLIGTNLTGAQMQNANLEEAVLQECYVFAASAWEISGTPATQSNLIITPEGSPKIKVDNLKIAQFIYLLIDNKNIRDTIQTIGKNAVLILGRFSLQRKEVLDAIAEKVRSLGFIPIIFDFDRPMNNDLTETITILAGLSLFVVADVTSPKSVPMELHAIIPNFMVPIVPIIQNCESPFLMFQDLQNKYDWVLDVIVYDNKEDLIKSFDSAVIKPALEMHDVLMVRKDRSMRTKHI